VLGYPVPIAEDHFPVEDLLAGRETTAHVPTSADGGWPWPMKERKQYAMTARTGKSKPRRRQVCHKGHDLTNPENAFTQKADDYLRCRLCRRDMDAKRRARQHEATKIRQASRTARKAAIEAKACMKKG
jgi:hypothetical protein